MTRAAPDVAASVHLAGRMAGDHGTVVGESASAWWEAGFGPELVSVTPPDAIISSGSTLSPKSLGKAPGLLREDGTWSGYRWQVAVPSRDNVATWTGNLGLKAGQYPGLDIDVLDEPLALALEAMTIKALGPAPCRIGRAPKRLLLYRTDTPMAKRRLEWRVEGEERPFAVEVLGQGQQFLVEGLHPATSKPYAWGEWHPVLLGAEALTEVSPAQVEAFIEQVREHLTMLGYDVSESYEGAAERKAVVQEQLEGEIEEVRSAVTAIPNPADATRDDYIRIGYAIKASLPAWPEEAFGIWAEWCERWEGGDNAPETIESDWTRMRPPFEVGAQWLYDMAARYGHTDRLAERFDCETPPTTPEGSPTTPARAPGFSVSRLVDLMSDPDLNKPVPWLIPGLVPQGAAVLLYGSPKAGKTTLAAAMCAAIAGGTELLGRSVTAGPVLYCDMERSRRLTIARLREPFTGQDIPETLLVATQRPSIADLRTCIKRDGVRFIVLDSLARLLAPDNENDAAEMVRLLAPWVDLAHTEDVTLVFIHHDRKSGGEHGAGARGSNGIVATVDVAAHLRREEKATDITTRQLSIVGNFDELTPELHMSRDGSRYLAAPTPTERRRSQLVASIYQNGEGRADEIAERLGLTRGSVLTDLNALVESGQLYRTGSGVRGSPHVFGASDPNAVNALGFVRADSNTDAVVGAVR